jgi:predicted RNase H-like HicB family nuclease
MIDVFISFKNMFNGKQTKDAFLAKQLYDELTKLNLEVFMSNETLRKKGASDFRLQIDQALLEARVLVVIATKKEFFFEPWIKYEWESFWNELISARKTGEIFTLKGKNIQIGDLPLPLRTKQAFSSMKQIFSSAEISGAAAYIYSCFPEKSSSKGGGLHQFVFPAVFIKEQDDSYTSTIPDLGLVTDGESIEKSFLFIKNFLQVYCEYAITLEEDILKPSKFEKIAEKYKNNIVMLVDAIVPARSTPPKQSFPNEEV